MRHEEGEEPLSFSACDGAVPGWQVRLCQQLDRSRRRRRSGTFGNYPLLGSSLNYPFRFPETPGRRYSGGEFVVEGVAPTACVSADTLSSAAEPGFLASDRSRARWRWLPAGEWREIDRSVAASFASASGAGGLVERSVVDGFAEVNLPRFGSAADGCARRGAGRGCGRMSVMARSMPVGTSPVIRKKPRLMLRFGSGWRR